MGKIEMDYSEKDLFINELIKQYVYERDVEWLKEQIEDYEQWEIEEQYYNNVSLSEIVSFMYDIFAYDNTREEIERKMNEFLGYYSNNILTKIDGMYYLFY